MEHQIQLTYALEVIIKRLHEHLDQVQDAQLTLARVHDENKVQRGVEAVHHTHVLADTFTKERIELGNVEEVA